MSHHPFFKQEPSYNITKCTLIFNHGLDAVVMEKKCNFMRVRSLLMLKDKKMKTTSTSSSSHRILKISIFMLRQFLTCLRFLLSLLWMILLNSARTKLFLTPWDSKCWRLEIETWSSKVKIFNSNLNRKLMGSFCHSNHILSYLSINEFSDKLKFFFCQFYFLSMPRQRFSMTLLIMFDDYPER